jgi:hypothetical protein
MGAQTRLGHERWYRRLRRLRSAALLFSRSSKRTRSRNVAASVGGWNADVGRDGVRDGIGRVGERRSCAGWRRRKGGQRPWLRPPSENRVRRLRPASVVTLLIMTENHSCSTRSHEGFPIIPGPAVLYGLHSIDEPPSLALHQRHGLLQGYRGPRSWAVF